MSMLGDLSTLMERRLPTRPTDITAGIRKPWLVQMYQKTSNVAENFTCSRKKLNVSESEEALVQMYQKTKHLSENH